MRQHTIAKNVLMSVTLLVVAQLTACGTIFYPERKGTRSGTIDPMVAVADGLGLLLFIVPGVIAFAVDFNNGTIYQPGGKKIKLTREELKHVTHDGKVDKAALGEVMTQKLSKPVDLHGSDVQITKLNSPDALNRYFESNHVVLAKL